jgi:acetyl-CoA carboxylase biotin carboxyl carrier protein
MDNMSNTPNKAKPSETAHKAGENIDVATLRDLMKLMNENDVIDLEYQYGDLLVKLSKRQTTAVQAVAAAPVQAAMMAAPLSAAAPAPAQAAAAADDSKYQKIASPMVGTFYSAPSPDSAAFVTVGATVNENTVVCLIEAMKVFNEIKAGVSGKIAKICLKNEETVEFGQVLFLVEPA